MAEDFIMELRNAKDNGNNTFDCEYNHSTFGWIPFTACADDIESQGRDIHAAILSGAAGQITQYTPPSIDELAAIERQWRDSELLWWDANAYRNQFYWSALSAGEQSRRLNHRQALLDYPEQAGFPADTSLRPARITITE